MSEDYVVEISSEEGEGSQSEADPLGSLYADHKIKDDVVIGPVEIKRPVLTFKFYAPRKRKSQPTIHSRCQTCEKETIKHYTCSECDQQFFLKHAMIAHLRIHKRLPSTCEICKKDFKNPHKLKQHMIKHSNEKAYACKLCKKAYKHVTSLRVHKCMEPKEKPYRCHRCPKSFSAKGQLLTHSRLHTGEKPYKCDICSQEFSQQTSLNNHLLKHKGIKPYICKFCKERFRQVSNMRKHLATNHADEDSESVSQEKQKKLNMSFDDNVRQKGQKKLNMSLDENVSQKKHKKSNMSLDENVSQKKHKKLNMSLDENVSQKTLSVSLVWYTCKNCKAMFSRREQFDKHVKVCN